jgi:pimeloyl-ACP methyl ester carboxylesterase
MSEEKIPLLLIPAFMCDGRFWHHQVTGLEDIADITIADHSQHDDIEKLAAHLLENAPHQTAIAGTSFGGYVALEMMRQCLEAGTPERISRLCLIATQASADTDEANEKRRQQTAEALGGKMNQVYSRVLQLLVHESRLADSAFLKRLYAMAKSLGPDVFMRQQQATLGRHIMTDMLTRVKCRTMVICGRQDKLSTLEEHQQMVSLLSRGNLVIVEKCGHLPPFECPQAVTEAMRFWLVGAEPYRRVRKGG